IFVGDGILKEKLKKMVKEKGIEKKVIFTGLVPPEKIPEYVSVIDIVVHTSLREGLPKAVAQALAGGKPVVSFNVDGAKEIVIDGQTGFLVKSKDINKLVEKIKILLENPEIAEKMGKVGREKILSMFSVDKMVDEIEKIYLNYKNGK
ncbi:MAG TPA: glycosyltransferase, partial [Candidatus Ratteibacteria bacterium]|nr:glycosyltransferase [Candidatus Ratteibacteria bacterium]